MEKLKSFFWMILFLIYFTSGCLQENVGQELKLNVNLDSNNGTVVESYSNGEHISTTKVIINFDFSETTATQKIITYGIDPMDGRPPININANSNSNINVEFSKHGIHLINAYAVDELNNMKNMTISIRIELRIDWVQSDTFEPEPLIFNPIPDNGGKNPSLIEIYSVVENPYLIENIGGGGQSVEFTWNLADEQNDVCQKKSEKVDDGEIATWKTIHFNTYEIHELRIIYDDGQDQIKVNQSVSIIYNDDDAL